jgi:hypothetical protein
MEAKIAETESFAEEYTNGSHIEYNTNPDLTNKEEIIKEKAI